MVVDTNVQCATPLAELPDGALRQRMGHRRTSTTVIQLVSPEFMPEANILLG